MSLDAYTVRRASCSRFIDVRGLRYHVLEWGDATLASAARPPLVMLHGWMDVAASFQFVVDALSSDRYVIALDWRGFGLTESPGADTYWMPDYLGDLDAALDRLFFSTGAADRKLDLLGHSMGGNVVMLYAGVRPERVRRLINLEGFGMPRTQPTQAPKRLQQWLDELKQPALMRDYASVEGAAAQDQPAALAATCGLARAALVAPARGGRWPARPLGNPRRPGAQTH
jgi:pimeloyl-ACP methyl ester carboxylesterase